MSAVVERYVQVVRRGDLWCVERVKDYGDGDAALLTLGETTDENEALHSARQHAEWSNLRLRLPAA